jgi:transcriptional regulator with XRE-family HTH domain
MAGQKTDERDVYLGQRIAEQRRKASLTQRHVAQSFGMSAAQLQKYEKGTNRISAIHLNIFSRMIGVPVEYFFRGMPNVETTVAPGFAEEGQAPFGRSDLNTLADLIGRQIRETYSDDMRQNIVAAVSILERQLRS